MSDENISTVSNGPSKVMFEDATEEERASATAHLHAMKAQIGGLLEIQTKARLIKEGLMPCDDRENTDVATQKDEEEAPETSEEMTMEKREEIEMDTEASEDITDVFNFLLPPGTVPPKCSHFGLSYNHKVLDGWVRQPSACCGAASVAGAWNALMNVHRSHEKGSQSRDRIAGLSSYDARHD